MKVLQGNRNTGFVPLDGQAMQQIVGGSLGRLVLRLVWHGAVFCYHFGVTEGRRTKAMM